MWAGLWRWIGRWPVARPGLFMVVLGSALLVAAWSSAFDSITAVHTLDPQPGKRASPGTLASADHDLYLPLLARGPLHVYVPAVPYILAPTPTPPGFDWPTYGYDVQRTGYNPNETTLGVDNVGGLHQLWSFPLGGASTASAVFVANVSTANGLMDLVYAGAENGMFYALNAATGQPVWQRSLGSQATYCYDEPGGVFGVTGTPALDRAAGRIYVGGGDGQVYALDMTTGDTLPGWPVVVTSDPYREHIYSAITLWNGKVYAEIAGYCDASPYHGRIVSIDAESAQVVVSWYPTGQYGPSGGGIWGVGGVSVDPADANVYAATGNARTNPENYGDAEKVVRLDAALSLLAAHNPGPNADDADLGSTPVLYTAPGCPPQLVVEDKFGALLVYDRDSIANGPVQSLQISSSNFAQFSGDAVYSPVTNMVYVANPAYSDDGTYTFGMVALAVQSNCTLSLAWQQPVATTNFVSSSPTVANGVVYYGDGINSQLLAFNAATGQLLWASPRDSTGPIYATPIVVNGRLYVGSWDQNFYAFGP